MDVGELHVIVPEGVALRAHGEARLGRVDVVGTIDDGRNADVDVRETGTRVLVLDSEVGVGSLHVERAPVR